MKANINRMTRGGLTAVLRGPLVEGPPGERAFMAIEQRPRAPRFPVQVPTEFQNSALGTGFTADVSNSGVRVAHASIPVRLETDLRLRFSFFLGSFATEFLGTVIRHAEDGFAIHFGSLDRAQIEVLRRALSLPPLPL